MKRWLLSLWVGVAALLGGPAHAVVVQQAYSGSVVSGSDIEGVFGAAGANLAGLTFTAVFTFDTARGNATTGPISPGPGVFVQLAGGTSGADPFLGTPTPLVAATLRIGGSAAIAIPGGSEDRTSIRSSSNPSVTASEYFSSTLGVNGDLLGVFVRSFAATYPNDLAAPGSYLASAGAVVGDQFRLVDATTFSTRAQGILAPSMLVVSVVPEPSAALLLAAGLAGLHGWLRPRRPARRGSRQGPNAPDAKPGA